VFAVKRTQNMLQSKHDRCGTARVDGVDCGCPRACVVSVCCDRACREAHLAEFLAARSVESCVHFVKYYKAWQQEGKTRWLQGAPVCTPDTAASLLSQVTSTCKWSCAIAAA
jgi:hypothetical protein